ncbi:MAG: S8 family serine peptidase [Phycisphaerae bacterium]|nr:S8 family serine peptidase [Phycisphaerae bacterium]
MTKPFVSAYLLGPLAASFGAATLLGASAATSSPDAVLVATPKNTQLIPSLARLTPAAIDGVQLEETPLIVPDEFVVNFDSDAALVVRTMATGADGLTGFAGIDESADRAAITAFRPLYPGADAFRDTVRGLPNMSGWFVVTVDTSIVSLDAAMDEFRANPFVGEVQPIGVHPVYAVPNDGNYSSQWHLNQTSDKDIDAPEGWDIENGSPTIAVAVLDTGVRYYHKDLGGANASSSNTTATNGNIWINTAEKNGVAGVDDDANGYIDDWVGYDFVTAAVATCWPGEDCTGADNDPRDFNGHGTHCAGNVGAMNNNGYATCSPAGGFGGGSNTATGDGVKVMCLRIGHSAKYQGQEVGFVRMDSAASSLYYAANKGAKVASCSWGSSNTGGLGAAATYFINAGGLIFKAAGNSNNQSADYLCSRSDVYSVAAVDQSDKKASFSSYGTWVDISAPGVSITSSYHLHSNPTADYVAALNGTSMATPLVASVAASVWSKHPTWTASQVWSTVKTNVDSISAANPSFNGKLGSGRINLQKALTP